MLGSLLKILCILGWCLLFLVLFLAAVILLVLFYPVSYRIEGQKNEECLELKARISWLSGFLRVRYEYPSPGNILIKVLGFTVFDSGKPKKEKNKDDKSSSNQTSSGTKQTDTTTQADSASQSDPTPQPGTDSQSESTSRITGDDSSGREETAASGRIRALWEKILYTIRQICDKIKKIYESFDYYLVLLQAEDTKQLFSHVMMRVGRILKSIRPRQISGEVHFGTGSPDTTGYGMAVYGMLSPYLGQNLTVTSDFEEKVLEGQLSMKGRIILAVLVYHGLRAILDRRLHYFIKKMKREVK